MSSATSWGPATWYLFHTLVEKIKPDSFTLIRTDLINIIKEICSTLPCPDCANHSTLLLSTYKNYHLIQTQEDMKKFIFEFHNMVNRNAKHPQQPTNVLERYKNANLSQVFQYWYQNFNTKGISRSFMINSIHRDATKKNVQSFLIKYQSHLYN